MGRPGVRFGESASGEGIMIEDNCVARFGAAALMVTALVGLLACERKQETTAGPSAAVESGPVASAKEPESGRAAVTGGAGSAATAPKVEATPADWEAAAMAVADRLADKVRKAGMRCDDYGPAPYLMYDDEYRERLPVPAAVTSCDTDGNEDLTFEVFADAAAARTFVEVKREFLCKRTSEIGLHEFPGFAYVLGDVWVATPDEKDTAEKLAPILGGEAKVADCVVR